jgi:hypothetical protein
MPYNHHRHRRHDGWRSYDLESLSQLERTLAEVDVDCSTFVEFMEPGGEGDQALGETQEAAEEEGIVGVPHYTFDDPATGKSLGMFGREHLALIRGKLHAEGLAKHEGVSSECSHAFSSRGKL